MDDNTTEKLLWELLQKCMHASEEVKTDDEIFVVA